MTIDTLFVDIGAMRVEIRMLKVQICCDLQTRALSFWLKQIPTANDSIIALITSEKSYNLELPTTLSAKIFLL